MTLGTTQGIVKVFDLSRRYYFTSHIFKYPFKCSTHIFYFRDAKMIGGSMNLKQQLPNFDTIRDLGISCDGNNVTMTVTKVRILLDQENNF